MNFPALLLVSFYFNVQQLRAFVCFFKEGDGGGGREEATKEFMLPTEKV